MNRTIRRGSVLLAAAIAVFAIAGAAFATNNTTPYDSKASSRSSFEVPGVIALGGHSSSETANAGASSEATGSSFSIAGQEVASGPSCSAAAEMGDNGNDSETKSGSAQTIGDETTPATVSLFSSSCSAQAQSNNNAHSSSTGAIADASAPGVAGVTVGRSASSTETTSGEANATSSFTGASVTAGDASVSVIECSSTASAGNDSSSTTSSSSLVHSGDTTVAFPEGSECPAGTASAEYERG